MLVPTAQLHARFDFDGRTRLSTLYTRAPLKIAKTFSLGSALSVCVMDASPGLLAGDYYDFNWHLMPQADVHITTQGFTRVHPSHDNLCRIQQKITLENSAHFEVFPEPLMLYKDAALSAETVIDITGNASLLMGEVFCAGRTGRGECWDFASYKNGLRVRLDGRLIYINQSAMRPPIFAPQSVGVFENFTHNATFLAFGPARIPIENLRAVFEEHPLVYGGVSTLENNGIIASLLGQRACDLQEALAALRAVARDVLR